MVLAGALGVLLTFGVVRAADHTETVLVAARDLTPGTVIDRSALRLARVHAGAEVIAALYRASDVDALQGRVVTAAVRPGELVSRRDVTALDAGAARRVMSFSLPRARAVDGKITGGDRVDVVVVEHDTGRAGYVLTGAEVVGGDARSSGALGGASDDVVVSLVVEPGDAPALAAALDGGGVTLVRATGARPFRPAQRFSTHTTNVAETG